MDKKDLLKLIKRGLKKPVLTKREKILITSQKNNFMNNLKNQKGFSNIAIIVLAVILAGVMGYFTLRKLPTTNQTLPFTSADNTFSINLRGYVRTCWNKPAIMYKRINDSWEEVLNELTINHHELYYLDGKFFGYGMCDVVVCDELPNPYTMELVEYKKIGDKVLPSDMGSTAPVYRTVPLRGDIKIEIQYFSDENCQNKKTFSTVIKR